MIAVVRPSKKTKITLTSQWRIQGRGPRPPPSPLIFRPNVWIRYCFRLNASGDGSEDGLWGQSKPRRLSHTWDMSVWKLYCRWSLVGFAQGAFPLRICGPSVFCRTSLSGDFATPSWVWSWASDSQVLGLMSRSLRSSLRQSWNFSSGPPPPPRPPPPSSPTPTEKDTQQPRWVVYKFLYEVNAIDVRMICFSCFFFFYQSPSITMRKLEETSNQK